MISMIQEILQVVLIVRLLLWLFNSCKTCKWILLWKQLFRSTVEPEWKLAGCRLYDTTQYIFFLSFLPTYWTSKLHLQEARFQKIIEILPPLWEKNFSFLSWGLLIFQNFTFKLLSSSTYFNKSPWPQTQDPLTFS